MEWLLIPTVALLFRLRGWSGIGSTLMGRLIYACGTALAFWAALHQGVYYLIWWLPPALAAALFVGCLPGWYGALDLGTNEGEPARDAWVMAARGIWFTAGAGAVVAWMDLASGAILAMSGASAVVWYAIGFHGPVPRWATVIGEVGTGATIGAALAVAA